jgi:hypothetical protein
VPEALGRCPGGGAGLPERPLQVSGESQGHPRDSRGSVPGNLWGPRICKDIDQQVQAFLSRPLESSTYAYVYLDATYLKGRLGKALQVCSRAVVVAMGVNADGRRKLLGIKVGDSENEAFWTEFISHLKERGLDGVKPPPVIIRNDFEAMQDSRLSVASVRYQPARGRRIGTA